MLVMPADPESTGWVAAIPAAVGIGGGGTGLLRLHTRQSENTTRIKALEARQNDHDGKILGTHTTVTRLDGRTERVESDVKAIRDMLERWRDTQGNGR